MARAVTLDMKILVGLSSAWNEEREALTIDSADIHMAEQAIWLASHTGGELRFLHAIDFIDKKADVLQERVMADLTAAVDALRDKASTAKVEARMLVRSGSPWRCLHDEAESWKADVIVVSPRRRDVSALTRLRYGSTARRLIKRAPCDVWVVDPGSPPGVAKLLALVDRGPLSPAVVSRARQLAAMASIRPKLVHCMDYPDDVVLQRLPHARKAIESYHRSEQERARADLAALVDGEQDRWDVALAQDWVVRVAPKVVAEENIDLIVIGIGPYVRLRGYLLGTSAERILEQSHCSTWVVRNGMKPGGSDG